MSFIWLQRTCLGYNPNTSHVLYGLLGAAAVSYDDPALSVDDLVDQVAEVLDYFGLGAVMCLGVTAGAYVLTLFAIKYTPSNCSHTCFSSMQITFLVRMVV